MQHYSHEYVKELAIELHDYVRVYESTPEWIAITMSSDPETGGWEITFDPESRFDPDETAFDGRQLDGWTGGETLNKDDFDALARDIRSNMIELDGQYEDR